MTDADWPWLQAEQARALAEPDDALAQFEAAWPRWPAPAEDPGWRTQLGLHLAELQLRLWRFDELEQLLPALHEAAQAQPDALLQARAALLQVNQDVRKGRLGLALTALGPLAALAQARPEPALRALHALALARVLQGQGEHERALVCLADALPLLPAAGLPRQLPLLWLRRAASHHALAQWPQYRAALQQCVDHALAQRDHAAACNALTGVVEDLTRAGEHAAAQATLQQAEALLARVPARRAQLEAEVLAAGAHLAAAQGRWPQAVQQLQQVIELKRASSTRAQTQRRLRELAPWQLQAGQPEAALASLQEAHELELGALRAAQAEELALKTERLEREQARQAQQGAEQQAQQLQQANAALGEALRVQRELLDQLVQSGRQAALGAMLAGLAHELNTPLGNALTAVSTTQERLRQTQRLFELGALGRRALQGDLLAALEGSELAQRNLQRVLQLLSGYQELNPELLAARPRSTRLAELVLQAWQRAVPVDTPLQLELQADVTAQVCADSLQAVLVELLHNVQRHAYPAGHAGRVQVRAWTAEGRHHLELADAGRGIPSGLLPRIFDPYVSTQFGQGRSGLGLFSAQVLVNTRLRGQLQVHSAPGEGTRFLIDWPVAA
ncbi:ATP-binding protein [Inhella sp.]|uniref:ATP-binding protein n=1 Tax=Inhella sp. TaxID=1921806 RepID=UPI0035AFC529